MLLLKQICYKYIMLSRVRFPHNNCVADGYANCSSCIAFFGKYLAFMFLERLQLPYLKKKDDGFSCMCLLKGNPLSVVENI